MKIKKASGILMAMCILAGSASGAVEASNGIDYYLIKDKDKLIHMSIEDYSNNFSNASSNYYQHFLKDRYLEIEYLVQKQGSEKFSDDKYVYLNDFLKSKRSNDESDSDVMSRVAEKSFGELKDILYKLSFEGDKPVYKKLEDDEVVVEGVSLKDGKNILLIEGMNPLTVVLYKNEIISIKNGLNTIFGAYGEVIDFNLDFKDDLGRIYDEESKFKIKSYYDELDQVKLMSGPVDLVSMDFDYENTTERVFAPNYVNERDILKVYVGREYLGKIRAGKIKQSKGGETGQALSYTIEYGNTPEFKNTGLLLARFRNDNVIETDFYIEQIRLENGQHTFEVYGDHNDHVKLGKEITLVMKNGEVESVVGNPELGVNNFIMKDKNEIQVSKDLTEQVKALLKNSESESPEKILEEAAERLKDQEPYIVDNLWDSSKGGLIEECRGLLKYDDKFKDINISVPNDLVEGYTDVDLELEGYHKIVSILLDSRNIDPSKIVQVGGKTMQQLGGSGTIDRPYLGMIDDMPFEVTEISGEDIYIDGDESGIKFYGVDDTFTKKESFTPLGKGTRYLYFTNNGSDYYKISVLRDSEPMDAVYLIDVYYRSEENEYDSSNLIQKKIESGEMLYERGISSKLIYQPHPTDILMFSLGIDDGLNHHFRSMQSTIGDYNNEGYYRVKANYDDGGEDAKQQSDALYFYVR